MFNFASEIFTQHFNPKNMITQLQKGKNYFYQISLAMLVAMISIVGCKKDEPTPLAIATFTPAFGSVGDVITINGSGFSTDLSKNIVKLGSLTAIVTYAVENSLQFTIPAGAVTGKVSVTTNGVTTVSTTDFMVKDRIYVAGYISKNNKYIAGYWKNGVFINLTDGTKDAYANAIVVVGEDVYVAGIEDNSLVYSPRAKYWKNGVATTLSTQNATVTGMTVIGNDVYIVGTEINSATNFVAKYWKNGIPTILSDGSRGEATGNIIVSGNDVYVLSTTNYGVSKYWKNGIPVTVSTNISGTPSFVSNLVSMAVSGSDVYVGGLFYDNTTTIYSPTASYWKNGVITRLSAGRMNSLTVADEIVHSTGISGGVSKYWKNEISSTLEIEANSRNQIPGVIAVIGTNVYIAGKTSTGAKYWKNGIIVTLDGGVGLDDAGATGITVIP